MTIPEPVLDPGAPDPGAPDPEVTVAFCTWCGTQAAGPPPTWSLQTSDRGRGLEWLCEACTRANVRSIEGKLDSDWW
jgi:hypothetical protein